MKRRIISLSIAFISMTIEAQIPPVPQASEPVCAECHARFTKGEDHKPDCPIGKKIAEAEAKAKANAWSPNFNSKEYKYGVSVPCPWCESQGRVKGHLSDCPIGKTQGFIRKAWDRASSPQAVRFRIETYEENIRTLAADPALRGDQPETQSSAKSQQPISTKLKDHQPMPEQFPKESGVLIPKMDRMPPPVLPTTIQLVNLREKANDGTSTVYDKRIQFRDSRSVVARGITNQNGSETWTLFRVSPVGEDKIATFSKILTIDEGDLCRYFVCRDMNGKWGLYNLYGKKELDHEFSSIEAIAYNDYNDKRGVVLKCCRNGKYGLLRDVGMTLNCEYDDIQLEGERAFRVLKNGRFGIVDTSRIPLIPVEYTYIERLSYQHVPHTFYIVSKDNIKYGIFVDSSTMKYKREDYSLGEAREQVKADAIKIMK